MKKGLFILTCLIIAMSFTTTQNNIYSYKVNGLEGGSIDFSQFKGKKILIVNVASQCGFTPQYEGLEQLHNKFKDKLVIVGFPCNQFGEQEPGTAKEIRQFCTAKYGVTFLMAEKVDVKGPHQAAIYKFLTEKALNGFQDGEPQWNFHKYLIDEHGNLIGAFPSAVKPMSDELVAAIKK